MRHAYSTTCFFMELYRLLFEKGMLIFNLRIPILHINGRVHIVHVLLVELFPKELNRFTKSLEVDDLPLPQELDSVVDIGVITKPEDIVVSGPGFLFRSQILRKIRNGISCDLDGSGRPWCTGGGSGVDAGGVVYEIGSKGRVAVLSVL